MNDNDLMETENWFDDLQRAIEPAAEAVDRMLNVARPRVARALRSVRRAPAAAGIIRSPLGNLLVIVSDKGLAMLKYAAMMDRNALGALLGEAREVFDLTADRAALDPVRAELERFFAGDLDSLSFPVDFRLAGHGFRRTVLERLRKVGPGAAISYQALGAWAGAPNASRAVGNAMHTNPIAIYVPCHRVIQTGGGLGGYAGGLDVKRKLLGLEGFRLGSGGRLMDTVLGHRGTAIFCRPGCRAAARANRAQQLTFCDGDHARRAGMRACLICRPGA